MTTDRLERAPRRGRGGLRARLRALLRATRSAWPALVDDGRVLTACNVENASYGLTLCAECGLVSALHATGGGRLVAVACVDGRGQPLVPCGRCRQLLHEHGGPELLFNARPLGELLPDAFGPEHLHRT